MANVTLPSDAGPSGPSLNPAQRIRIMLVDDEPMVVRGLARNMMSMGVKMDIIVRTSADEALKSLETEMVDVIVTDLYMPGKNGTALLREVRARYPSILRFVLSGEARPEAMLEASRVAHQYLSKPFDTACLQKIIVETLSRLSAVKRPEIAKTIAYLEGVPSRQATLSEFIRLLNDNSASLDSIAASIKKDPALSARLLKVANSPYFGYNSSIETLDDAVSVLGLDMIVSMAATHKLFSIAPPPPASNIILDKLWEHCVHVSSLVNRIGYSLKVQASIVREACTAALMHDIGKLVLAYAAPTGEAASLTRAKADHMPEWQAEYYVFENHHAEIGGCLLKLWGLPEVVVEAVAKHHAPHRSSENTVGPVTLVHIADAIAHAQSKDNDATFLDGAHLKALGLPERLEDWLQVLDR